MGYNLNAFISTPGLFADLRRLSDRVVVAPLDQGFELLLYDLYLERAMGIPDKPRAVGYEAGLLSQGMVHQALVWSQQQPITYVEADYFGGVGTQYSVLWQNGAVVAQYKSNNLRMEHADPLVTVCDKPINEVLKRIGVQKLHYYDEFEAVGLPKHRHPESWFAAYTSYSINDYEPYD
jgi:hypothetical protein